MNFLEGLELLFLYLQISGTVKWSWAIVMLPIIVDIVIFMIHREIKRDLIARLIQRKLCEQCENREDCDEWNDEAR